MALSSPASLLWAHQLKRENTYVLDRIKLLEAENLQLRERVTSTEGEMQRVESTIGRLLKKVDAIDSLVNDTRDEQSDARSEHAVLLQRIPNTTVTTLLPCRSPIIHRDRNC